MASVVAAQVPAAARSFAVLPEASASTNAPAGWGAASMLGACLRLGLLGAREAHHVRTQLAEHQGLVHRHRSGGERADPAIADLPPGGSTGSARRGSPIARAPCDHLGVFDLV